VSEFGHFYARGDGFCIDSWGAGPFLIEAGGKQYRFEDSDRFGPSLIKKNGDPLANPYPGERSPFWKAHYAWLKQGRRVAEDGVTCIWEPLKPSLAVRKGRGFVLVVEHGDQWSDEVVVLQPGDPRIPAHHREAPPLPPKPEHATGKSDG
jgi:hypothetical protein